MGLLNRLFGRGTPAPENEKSVNHLAFVLLSEARLPEAQEIANALRDFPALNESLQAEVDKAGEDASKQVVSLKLNTGERAMIALCDAPVPKGEADHHAQYSLSSFRNGWRLPPHCANFVVAFNPAVPASPIVRLSRFTSLLAAVTKSSPAVGVYWGNAGATHDSEFFLSIASSPGIVPRMMLWSGVSIAREEGGRLSLLSLGMKQLNLPDFLLTADGSSANGAVATLFDLLSYVANRGEKIPEGHTVGTSADQRLPVYYVQSPVDPAKKVCSVRLA
jgi:hypothetical protein